MNKEIKSFVTAVILLTLSLVIGLVGFVYIEDYTIGDAFYMTVITFSTVGFNEVNPLSENGRLFTSFYIIFNLGIFAYVVSVVTTYIFEGKLNSVFKNFISTKEVKKMKGHIIVCGYGRNGKKACEELYKNNRKFILVEFNEELLFAREEVKNYQVVIGDATHDETLCEAGIEKASALITTLPNDAANVFITLTAKELNPNLTIISRASQEQSEKKLLRAGASKVIMPDAVGGTHMAQLIIKPYVIEFLELLTGEGSNELKLEEVVFDVFKDEFRGKSVRELDVRNRTGVTVVGFRDPQHGFIFNPSPDTKILRGDVMIISGSEESIKKFKTFYT
ncbi:potassium channel protein [Reichenbachiella sp. MALMAid0571]|uniref:potassium channel family protein n=1 Tax=Reichenbachiella sp. MALMAid0571 TaxID=3143939 RepID=UPI0032DF172E